MSKLPIYDGQAGQAYESYYSAESMARPPQPSRCPALEVLGGAVYPEVDETAASGQELAACVEPDITARGDLSTRSGRLPTGLIGVEFV